MNQQEVGRLCDPTCFVVFCGNVYLNSYVTRKIYYFSLTMGICALSLVPLIYLEVQMCLYTWMIGMQW